MNDDDVAPLPRRIDHAHEPLTTEGRAYALGLAVDRAAGEPSMLADAALHPEHWRSEFHDAACRICNRLALGEPAGGVSFRISPR